MAQRRTRRRLAPPTESVSADQRFTAEDPCPICGGHPGDPRGEGVRCWGFRSSDGSGAVCTRIESDRPAGNSGGWCHPLDDPTDDADPGRPDEERDDATATYVYEDEGGVPLFRVVRRAGKRFHQELPNGTKQVAGVRQVPFHLPALLSAVKADETIYIAEGEKDVLSLEGAGCAATTNAGGAGKWRDEFAEHFEGARVVVIADKDEKGEAHARHVRRSLLAVASEVSIAEARTGKDATDHLEAGNAVDDLVLVPPRFEQMQLGTYEPQPADWLAEPVLIERAYTVITSKPGKGKTALALCLSIPLIEDGRTVVLLDQENGPDTIATRLRAMGADPSLVDQRFAYFPFPSAAWGEVEELVAEVAALRPGLVIVDAKANFLAAADLDEDLAADLTRWHSTFVQPLQESGAAVLELDHSGHKEQGRPRGSSAKEAVAEASWVLTSDRSFDPGTTTQVTLRRGIKNRLGLLPEQVVYQMGGDGEGGFLFRQRESEAERQVEDRKRKREHIRAEIIDALREHGELSGNQLDQAVRGADTRFIREVYKDLPSIPGSGVKMKMGKRGAFLYYLTEDGEGKQ